MTKDKTTRDETTRLQMTKDNSDQGPADKALCLTKDETTRD